MSKPENATAVKILEEKRKNTIKPFCGNRMVVKSKRTDLFFLLPGTTRQKCPLHSTKLKNRLIKMHRDDTKKWKEAH